jgi:hypothetical protein
MTLKPSALPHRITRIALLYEKQDAVFILRNKRSYSFWYKEEDPKLPLFKDLFC